LIVNRIDPPFANKFDPPIETKIINKVLDEAKILPGSLCSALTGTVSSRCKMYERGDGDGEHDRVSDRLAPIHCTGCCHLSRQAKFSHFKGELSSSSKEHEVVGLPF